MPRVAPMLLLLAMLLTGGAQAEPVLRSAVGDRVEVISGPGCAGAACSPVRVCLKNPSRNTSAKGLSNHDAEEPDLVAQPGQTRCLDMTNVLQKITLWNAAGDKPLAPVMVTVLDLRGKLGQIVYFRWSTEAPAPKRP